MKDYERQLNMTYANSDKEWFIDILKRELEVDDMLIHKDKYKGRSLIPSICFSEVNQCCYQHGLT